MSTTFIRATGDQIDSEINRYLKRICLLLALDRATLAQTDPLSQRGTITHAWARKKDRVFPTSLDPNERLPWHAKKMLAGEIIVYSNLDELPEEARIDCETLRPMGPESAVVVPIRVKDATVGAVAFGVLSKERRWPEKLVERFRLVADIFGYALERKWNEAQFQRLQNELAHVSRVATLGELTASLAHELNQPLGAILSNTEAVQLLLQTAIPDLKEIGAALEEIADNDRRASEIIKRFRAMFKRGEVKQEPFSTRELFDAVQRLVKGEAATRQVGLRFECQSALPEIIADPIALQQVLLNLILNSFDAVCAVQDGRREVAISVSQRQPEFVQITVGDSGPGIAPEAMPKLFDAFFTTKPEGMGMGLAVARSIVEAHGGSLWAAANPEGGAVFEFTVPAASGEDRQTQIPRATGQPFSNSQQERAKIAIIDDDASQLSSLVRLLASAGHEVCAFASAAEFLAGPECESFSCVVSDVRMPGMDGLELQATLRGKSPSLAIILITGDVEVHDTVTAIKGGAVDYLEKPVTREVLLEAIGRAVQRAAQSRAAAKEVDRVKLRYQTLTPREREVFALVSAGLLNKQVAAELGAALQTIKQHRGRVMAKMKAESTAELVVFADRLGVRPAGDFASAKGRMKAV